MQITKESINAKYCSWKLKMDHESGKWNFKGEKTKWKDACDIKVKTGWKK